MEKALEQPRLAEREADRPSSLPTAERIKTQAAYTEAEAKDEVVAAARAFEKPGFCDKDDCDCCDGIVALFADLRRALNLVDTYKGVK